MTDNDAMDAAFMAATAGFLHEFNMSAETSNFPLERVFGHCPDANSSLKTPSINQSIAEETKRKANERRDRYRKKMRNEREMLRHQERELSAELSRLQEAQAKVKEEEKKSNTLALSAWRATAARQKERRLEAEQMQQQLKSAIRCRADMIRYLSIFVMQPGPTKSLASCGEQTALHGSLLFKTFVGELDSLYDQTNDLIGGAAFKRSAPETFAMNRRWNEDRSFIESADATVIPVDFERTWRAMSIMFLLDPNGSHYKGEIDDPENTAAITYRFNSTVESGETATLIIYNALRRYVKADRVVFVWRVLTEGQGEFADLYSDEHAWLVLRPTDSTDCSATILESYTRLNPMSLDGQIVSDDSRGTRFVKLLMKADEEDVDRIRRAMHKLLVDEPGNLSPDSDVVMELNL